MSDTVLTTDPDALYCPHCNYDVRHTTEARCPECGKPFDRTELKSSRIPWVQRKEIGWTRGFGATVWKTMWSPQSFIREVSLPAGWREASRFRWICLGLASGICAISAAVFSGMNGPGRGDWLNIENYQTMDGSNPLYLPFFIPLARWWHVMGTVALCVFAGGAAATWWIRTWFWAAGRTAGDRASALSCYFAAWLPVFAAVTCGNFLVILLSDTDRFRGMMLYPVATLFIATHVTVIVAAWVGLVRQFRGMTRVGPLMTFVGAVLIPTGAVVCFAAAFGVVDYVAGFALIVWKSVVS